MSPFAVLGGGPTGFLSTTDSAGPLGWTPDLPQAFDAGESGQSLESYWAFRRLFLALAVKQSERVTIKCHQPHQVHSSSGRPDGLDRDNTCLRLRNLRAHRGMVGHSGRH